MKPSESEQLQRIGEAISEGKRVDWDQEARRSPGLTRILEALSSLERVGSALTPTSADPSAQPEVQRSSPRDDARPMRWGKLQIVQRVDQGAFGEVFIAYDASLQRNVALKLLRTERQGVPVDPDRYLEEARALARVRHPNVLVVHGAEVHDGRAGVWTDLVRGQTLEALLSRQGPMGTGEAILVGLDLCRALAAVHAEGLVHRDVKTSNVVREEGGRIVLLDFGAAEPSSDIAGRVEGGQGTPVAMAPEQFEGGRVGPQADIYGLGVLLYRLVSGRYPIEAADVEELREKSLRGVFTPLRDRRPELPSRFVAVVERALAPRLEERFPSAAALERGLLATLGDNFVSGRPLRNVQPRRDRALTFVLLALATIAVIALLRLPWRPGDLPRTAVEEPAMPPVRRATPTATPGAANLVTSATLFRKTSGREFPVSTGDRVAPGDYLFLHINASAATNLYVLNEDEHGRLYVLFPLAGTDTSNPLRPGFHRLPGRLGGAQLNWQVTSAGGNEIVAIIAARRPIAPLEEAISRFPAARLGGPVTYGELDVDALDVPRGIGGIRADRDTGEPAGRLATLLGWLPVASDSLGIWVREIQLHNPGS